MTNEQFIAKYAHSIGYTSIPSKTCNNLFFERGVIYSYGYHYPLLFKVNGKVFRNIQGYSVTTSKHIGLAGIYKDFDIKIKGNNTFSNASYAGTLEQFTKDELQNEYNSLNEKIIALSPRAWKQKETLYNRLKEVVDASLIF
jgi:hypothetical protein